MLHCPECVSTLSCVSALWFHLQAVHKAEKSQNFRCNEANCYRICTNWKSFRKHLLTFHSFIAKIEHKPSAASSSNFNEEDMDVVDPPSPEPQEEPIRMDNSSNLGKTIFNLIVIFVLSLYSNRQVPRSHVQEVLCSVKDLVNSMVTSVKEVISQKLSAHGLNETAIKEVESLLDSLLEPFTSFSTEYRRFKLFEELGCLIPFESYIVGDRVDDKMVQGSIVKETVAVEAHFLPMRLVLKKLFSLPNVFKLVKDYMNYLWSETGVIENFMQGKLWKNKMKEHFQGKFVIPLFVYFDDFEINNVLGSHTGIQKLGALYYSVPCFPPEINSMTDNIFVAGLFHSSDRMSFKNHRIFHKIIDELNFLQEEGIEVDGSEERVYFSLGLLLGDNLGLNSILGFVESFNAFYYCRLCSLSKDEIRRTFTERNLRFETYDRDILLDNVQLTGIKEKCVWDNVRFFRAVYNFAVDWLHDGPEGWGKEIVTLVLNFLVTKLQPKEQRLSLKVLNGRLRSFNYHQNAISNPPPSVSYSEVIEKKSLKMSGSEMHNFILIFAMLVGDLVPQDCEEWKLYCIFRQIMDIVTCRRLQPAYCKLIKTLVEEALLLFRQVFPDETIKPKSHNFTHYGTVLEESGPVINLSTALFERKHKEKKQEAAATTSRKNITHTLMVKEQLNLCERFVSKRGIESCGDYGGEKCLDDVSCCEDYTLFKSSLPHQFNGPCVMLNWVEVNGIRYQKLTCVVLRFDESDDNQPVFGLVDKILQNEDGDTTLVCKILLTFGFSSHFHAYDVEFTPRLDCVSVKDLLSPFPVILHRMGDGTLFATVRHKL